VFSSCKQESSSASLNVMLNTVGSREASRAETQSVSRGSVTPDASPPKGFGAVSLRAQSRHSEERRLLTRGLGNLLSEESWSPRPLGIVPGSFESASRRPPKWVRPGARPHCGRSPRRDRSQLACVLEVGAPKSDFPLLSESAPSARRRRHVLCADEPSSPRGPPARSAEANRTVGAGASGSALPKERQPVGVRGEGFVPKDRDLSPSDSASFPPKGAERVVRRSRRSSPRVLRPRPPRWVWSWGTVACRPHPRGDRASRLPRSRALLRRAATCHPWIRRPSLRRESSA
jgi:hypothetical protein